MRVALRLWWLRWQAKRLMARSDGLMDEMGDTQTRLQQVLAEIRRLTGEVAR